MLHALAASVALAQPAQSPTPVPTVPTTLSVTPTSIALNPAQQRIVRVSGAVGSVTATLERNIVRVSVDPDETELTITATQATGDDVLHVGDSTGARADVAIRVAFNAGTIVPQATLDVTGDPAAQGWLASQAVAYVTRLTQTLPGAQATVTAPAPPVAPLRPGDRAEIVVPVAISSGDDRYLALAGSTTLNVQNVPASPLHPAILFYDDDPEHITQDGVLFRGIVTAAQPAGLYYYHDNGMLPRRLVVALTAVQEPASVQVIDSSAGPNIDVMQVGHTVSRNFLHLQPSGEGIIVDVAPGEPYIMHDVPITARQGAAGNVYLRVMSGGPVTATVLAVSPGVDPRALLDSPRLPGDGHHRTGAFRLGGFGNDVLRYAAGSSDAKVVIGDTDPTPPNAEPDGAGHDYGDYGVLHSIAIDLTNPTGMPATAYLYFRPIGGIARGSFLVDGTLIELGCVREPVPYQIAALPLAAGQRAQTTVLTMTDGGSFYPVEIGVTATPPQPSAPPINAANGCFPKP